MTMLTGPAGATSRPDTSVNNAGVLRRWVDSLNRGAPVLADTFSPDCIVRFVGTPELHGPQQVAQFVTAVIGGFPDLRFTIEDQVAAGDVVVTRWSAEATHAGDFMGLLPTGRRVTFTGIAYDRFEAGKIVERWEHFDRLGLLEQIGAVLVSDQA